MERFQPITALTSSEAATLLDVHPSTVKRWCNEGELDSEVTPGGHRRIRVERAVDFARDRGIRTVLTPFRPYEPHVWTALSRIRDEGSYGDLHALALQWVRRGELERLEHLFIALGRSDYTTFCGFCDHGIRGLLSAVGDEWEAGRMRVGDEHLVSQAMTSVLHVLRRAWLDADAATNERVEKPVALVGTLEGNQHQLGSLCVRILLERLGWRVFYPGGDVPTEDFGMLQKSREASLVCISLPPGATAGDVARNLSLLAGFYDRGRPFDLVFGGAVPADVLNDLEHGPFASVSFLNDCSSLREAVDGGLGRLPHRELTPSSNPTGGVS